MDNFLYLKRKNKTINQASYHELKQIVLLSYGCDLYATDDVCWVLLFEDRFWVSPISSMSFSKDSLKHHPHRDHLYCEANISMIPISWRKRFFNLIPYCLPVVGSHVFSMSQLPSWEVTKAPQPFPEF